jgi:ketosteroid isomerase-like protein
MAHANIDILRRLYAAIMVGDIAQVLTLIDSERLEVHEPESLPYGGVHRGTEGFTRAVSRMAKCWTDVKFSDFSFAVSVDGEDSLIASFTMSATARATGVNLSFAVLEAVRFADGKIVAIKPFYWDTHSLRKPLGLAD